MYIRVPKWAPRVSGGGRGLRLRSRVDGAAVLRSNALTLTFGEVRVRSRIFAQMWCCHLEKHNRIPFYPAPDVGWRRPWTGNPLWRGKTWGFCYVRGLMLHCAPLFIYIENQRSNYISKRRWSNKFLLMSPLLLLFLFYFLKLGDLPAAESLCTILVCRIVHRIMHITVCL